MKIIAHRGSSKIWPENTLLAFDRAHQAGASGFETDLRLSKDDKIILSHDADLARFGHPDKVIHELDCSEICDLQIQSPDGRFRDNLIDLVTLLQKYRAKDYIFDCKISDERLFQILKETLSDLRFHDGVWFLTWCAKADKLVQTYFPGYAIFPRESRTRLWGLGCLVGLGKIFEPRSELLSLPAFYHGLPLVNRAQIADLHRRGKRFLGYLVNSKTDFERCQQCGVQMVLTDYPDLISQLLQ
ncbi:MAG: glycerophosphodiester phosphodiesterase [bacterium]